jgi:hypothetical protein
MASPLLSHQSAPGDGTRGATATATATASDAARRVDE